MPQLFMHSFQYLLSSGLLNAELSHAHGSGSEHRRLPFCGVCSTPR
jgi:hypothetical protein